jgi:hypothetical protein
MLQSLKVRQIILNKNTNGALKLGQLKSKHVGG